MMNLCREDPGENLAAFAALSDMPDDRYDMVEAWAAPGAPTSSPASASSKSASPALPRKLRLVAPFASRIACTGLVLWYVAHFGGGLFDIGLGIWGLFQPYRVLIVLLSMQIGSNAVALPLMWRGVGQDWYSACGLLVGLACGVLAYRRTRHWKH